MHYPVMTERHLADRWQVTLSVPRSGRTQPQKRFRQPSAGVGQKQPSRYAVLFECLLFRRSGLT